MSNTNPLLENFSLPPFDLIRPEHVEPAVDQILEFNRKTLKTLLETDEAPTWDRLLQPVEDFNDRLNRVWSPVSHLHAVADNSDLRKAYNASLQKLSTYETELKQNETLYRAYKEISGTEAYNGFNQAQKKIIANALREFRLSGIGLEPDRQKEFKKIKQRLDQLQTSFEENLLDATNAWTMHITRADRLKGLPETARSLAAQTALRKGMEGWLFTLDLPSYYPVMQYAEDSELRREMYDAYITRASDKGPEAGKWDNSGVMVEILGLRTQLAELLGFESYAHYSMERKMAESPILW